MVTNEPAGAASAPPNERGPWIDPRFAAAYDRGFAQQIAPLAARALLRLAQPAAGELVLECACGTGALSAPLAQALGQSGRLLCTDRAPAMLTLAAAKSYPADSANPRFALQDLLALGLPAGCFDLALCNLALQIVPDRGQALGELRRVLRPGGRLAFAVPGAWSLEPFWTYFWERAAQSDVQPALREPPRRWQAPDIAAALWRDREAWDAALRDAGFVRIALSVEADVAWFASAADFFASGAFGHIGRARALFTDDAVRDQVFGDVGRRIEQGRNSFGTPMNITVLCAVAYAP